jgi:hypothetical protein
MEDAKTPYLELARHPSWGLVREYVEKHAKFPMAPFVDVPDVLRHQSLLASAQALHGLIRHIEDNAKKELENK